MALSTLTQLSNLISQSVATLERISTETGIALPDLDYPTIAVESELLRTNTAAIEAARAIAAAGRQLAALTMPPKDYVFEVVFGAHLAASLRVCMEANATEILREAGPHGLHADKIAGKSHIDGGKLGAYMNCGPQSTIRQSKARIMRHLASHHIYREVAPDTFANNRLSATLDTKKPVAELFSDPDNKHTGTSDAFPAAAAWTLDLWAKAACNLWETLKDPEAGFSNETIDSTWHRTLGIDVPFHRWFEQPSQRKLRTLFGIAIKGYAEMNPPSTVLDAFPWASLPEGAVIVDVGGGIGSAALLLGQKYPHLRVIVQDLPEVAANAQKNWQIQFPEVHQSGQVTFEGHDFFTPQPVRNASVFFLRYIVHNWSDPYARKILTHLRDAANPDTTLVVVDHILPYACPQEALPPDIAALSEALDTAAPPLLPNFGAANALGHSLDSLASIS
ncbi:S-adenosyl-L-methionine-dependent methyltransferase [Mycena sanguinolenta]|uniref:S-adenosyl-L-methionine-dependent methyltransferase n=1 Tax=Mycena sanguinolenta TaxID=230812 RepID=A0A8H7CX31_9AGAR|nr:S-adenosyl-L-methionine-dependent methyltransferase [Mycena sanguinolenta]